MSRDSALSVIIYTYMVKQLLLLYSIKHVRNAACHIPTANDNTTVFLINMQVKLQFPLICKLSCCFLLTYEGNVADFQTLTKNISFFLSECYASYITRKIFFIKRSMVQYSFSFPVHGMAATY